MPIAPSLLPRAISFALIFMRKAPRMDNIVLIVFPFSVIYRQQNPSLPLALATICYRCPPFIQSIPFRNSSRAVFCHGQSIQSRARACLGAAKQSPYLHVRLFLVFTRYFSRKNRQQMQNTHKATGFRAQRPSWHAKSDNYPSRENQGVTTQNERWQKFADLAT